ncbi:hypothetical protein PUN28_007376 [Cardiocondyla obscurior]|uniref:Uncharacterized protein n=1 Tax=Cardiocondyla obscurior TaxID=286306 RepID=A0AAW2G371_9HYME
MRGDANSFRISPCKSDRGRVYESCSHVLLASRFREHPHVTRTLASNECQAKYACSRASTTITDALSPFFLPLSPLSLSLSLSLHPPPSLVSHFDCETVKYKIITLLKGLRSVRFLSFAFENKI